MTDANRTRRRALFLVVLAILVALGVLLMVGLILGDHSDQIDPQNGEVATLLLH